MNQKTKGSSLTVELFLVLNIYSADRGEPQKMFFP
jgi:hypothetical protein